MGKRQLGLRDIGSGLVSHSCLRMEGFTAGACLTGVQMHTKGGSELSEDMRKKAHGFWQVSPEIMRSTSANVMVMPPMLSKEQFYAWQQSLMMAKSAKDRNRDRRRRRRRSPGSSE
ncbi:hypothetical protein AK812_SmicGene13802 [Symbiodinium microadriaticum]|uniref:Uncharacterized protein n=1 Tax=Symbiodinium microadriaticum TaxID=2951 RepID=A0A1Q9E740_SYMMI|nr:hypothetical protein AK812_SmicGene13802 [Symbiodinium microadriaticum]